MALGFRFDPALFFANAMCALALNFAIFLVIGRTGAVTVRVVGVLKDWVIISISTLLFADSVLSGLTIGGYSLGEMHGRRDSVFRRRQRLGIWMKVLGKALEMMRQCCNAMLSPC